MKGTQTLKWVFLPELLVFNSLVCMYKEINLNFFRLSLSVRPKLEWLPKFGFDLNTLLLSVTFADIHFRSCKTY